MNNTELIKSVLQFTEDDIAANREGRLSKYQIARLSRKPRFQWFPLFRLVGMIALGFFPACFLSPVFWLILTVQGTRFAFDPAVILLTICLVSMVALLTTLVGIAYFRSRPMLDGQSVECVTGTLMRGKPVGSEFSLTVAESQLKAPSELHGMLEDGASYRVFSFQGEVLALERLDLCTGTEQP